MSENYNSEVNAIIEKKDIPTYFPDEPVKLPIFHEKRAYQGASGRVYPIPVRDGFTDERADYSWKVGIIENEYLRVEVLPEIGGKIKRAYDKKRGYDFVYHNSIIKPAGIGLAGAWISGGIEFNWPQHHRPTTFMPQESAIEHLPDGSKTIWTGETEPLYKMKGMAGVTLEPGRSYVKVKGRIYNGTPFTQPFMWWANLAAPATESYRIIFPQDVEFVVDHDRKAVMSWPIAKGVYGKGRVYDFGEGTDLSRNIEIKPQASFMVPMGQSNYDFISGYDEQKQMGIVSVSDHNVAPAKKLFTWGVSEHSDMWRMNLTDDDGPYIEIMTGAFTDNQPDFSWIQPYETKEFEQFWYPIAGIGMVKNATVDAALNTEERDGKLYIGVLSTGVYKNCSVEVTSKGNVIFSDKVSLTPNTPYESNAEIDERFDMLDFYVSVKDENDKTLVDFKPCKRGEKVRPEPRQPAKKPEDIATNEELYLNGIHLIQYRHHSFAPEDYFLEALKRDPGDSRCNLEMGKILLSRGQFREALFFFEKAVERLKLRNETPYDAEVYYQRGLTLRYLGEPERAYDSIYKSVWQNSNRTAGYFLLAEIDAARGEYDKALAELDLSLETGTKNNKAKALKAAVLRHSGKKSDAKQLMEESAKQDVLDLSCRMELFLLDPDNTDLAMELTGIINDKPDYIIDLAIGYINAGFFEDAVETLSFTAENPLTLYYTGYCYEKLDNPEKAIDSYLKADAADSSYCFPSRLEDIAVLKGAVKLYPSGSMAPYYLGCLFYDKTRYDDAILCFEHSKICDDSFSHIWRNLAVAYYDKKKSFFDAKMHMEKALMLDRDPRMFYEYQMLLKNIGESIERRLELYGTYAECSEIRDDSFIEKITLIGMQGRYDEAISMAKQHKFHVYEGGEGKISRLHSWLHILKGNMHFKAGEIENALEYYLNALEIPKNYSEARNPLNEESHIFFHIGMAKERGDDYAEATSAYYTAASDKGYVTELSIWRAFALMKIGKGYEAQKVLNRMIDEGKKLIRDKDDYPYFVTGPAPQPFENDIAKKNMVNGLVLQAYGYLGLGEYEKASFSANELEKLDNTNMSLYIYRQIEKDVR